MNENLQSIISTAEVVQLNLDRSNWPQAAELVQQMKRRLKKLQQEITSKLPKDR